ncbi:protein translocase subunit SecF [Alphaproteobacteria bacterium]|jgi:preprotein translocase SecF subunit|nr:protein translocase subunit SecF [Alphaproteobacteria bacterium]MDC1115999.1 protein translocase subunit SecF [Alphaproteobacteria bacterium]
MNGRVYSSVFSGLLVAGSILVWLMVGLNTGIDFRGGFVIEVKTLEGAANVEELREELGDLNLGDISLQEFGSDREVLIRVQSQDEGMATDLSDANKQAIQLVQEQIADRYEIRRTEFVGAVVGDELRRNAIYAVIAALGSIMIYIWFRFEWPFAISAILALAHDIITTIGLFSLSGIEFNLATVAALLTIAGYSINDTVVIFDRIRDNLKKYKSWDNDTIINTSLSQTISRTLMTSITTLIALLAIYFFGGAVLGGFALAMIWGVLIGTYSSIYVASTILSRFDLRPSDDDDMLPTHERNDPKS